MSNPERPRAHRCAVVTHEPRIGGARYDYADAFEIQLDQADGRLPAQLFRAAFERARWVRWMVPIVHRYLLRFRLGTSSQPDHVLGWRIASSEADLIHLEADGPLMRGVIVARRARPTRLVLTTFVYYRRRALARIVWTVVGPLHRRVAPYLLERAATAPGLATTRFR